MKITTLVLALLNLTISTAVFACGGRCTSEWVWGGCAHWENYSCLSNENFNQTITINVQLAGYEKMVGCSARWDGFNETEIQFHLASERSAQDQCRHVIETTKAKHGNTYPKEVVVSYVTRRGGATAYATCLGQGTYTAVGDNFQDAFQKLFQVMREHPTTGNCSYRVDNEVRSNNSTYPAGA